MKEDRQAEKSMCHMFRSVVIESTVSYVHKCSLIPIIKAKLSVFKEVITKKGWKG